ncbi:MAG: phosphohydrolase [Phycisphaerae bacterium]
MMQGWIQTFTGRKFFPRSPRPQDVDIRDIAHALSLKCRFNGHCKTFYSIAEHSLRVSRLLQPQGPRLALWGLLHDSAEAYLPDLGAPIKNHFHLHDGPHHESFDEAEDRLLAVIARALRVDPIDYASVRQADLTLLATEARDLLSPPPEPWNLPHPPLEDRITPASPTLAESAFLERFTHLTR